MSRRDSSLPQHTQDAAVVGVTSTEAQRKKRGPWFVVFVVALIVFIVSVCALGVIGFSYWQGQHKYGQIADMAGIEAVETEQLELVSVDWDALKAANPDTVAWVYMPGTPINYPVVQGKDNDYYLYVDYDGDAGWLANYGAIFLDYRNASDFSDRANFIYGHHMNDGSMFAELARLADQARFDECRTVYLLTPTGNYKLRTFALLHVEATDALVQNEFKNNKEFRSYVKDKIDRSIVSVDDTPKVKDIERVFALATCDDYGAGRYVLYSYPEEETAQGLSGNIGLSTDDGKTTGFDQDISVDTPNENSNE